MAPGLRRDDERLNFGSTHPPIPQKRSHPVRMHGVAKVQGGNARKRAIKRRYERG
jgi:hypothetical protein